MKAQVNKLEAERQMTNRVMFIFLLVVGSVILFIVVKNIYNDVFSKTHSSYEILNPNRGFSRMGYVVVKKSNDIRNMEDANYISPLEPCCAKQVKAGLEIKKMKGYLNSNKRILLQQILEALADVEEPECFIEEVFRMFKTQETQFEEALEVEEWMTNEESWNVNTNISLPASATEIETESTLEVENWMTDEKTWKVSNHLTLPAYVTETATESEMDIEKWMTDNETWSVNNYATLSAYVAETATESALEIESWMTNHKTWTVNNYAALWAYVTENAPEEALEVEEWMTNDEAWEVFNYEALVEYITEVETESELEIEEWMTSNETWNVNNDMNLPEYVTETATEKELEVEEWMTNENNWNVKMKDQHPSQIAAKDYIQTDGRMVAENIWK